MGKLCRKNFKKDPAVKPTETYVDSAGRKRYKGTKALKSTQILGLGLLALIFLRLQVWCRLTFISLAEPNHNNNHNAMGHMLTARSSGWKHMQWAYTYTGLCIDSFLNFLSYDVDRLQQSIIKRPEMVFMHGLGQATSPFVATDHFPFKVMQFLENG